MTAPDMVNHPPHYLGHASGLEVIEVTQDMGFLLGNAAKYLLRADHKGDAATDYAKARWYVDRFIARLRPGEADEPMPWTMRKMVDDETDSERSAALFAIFSADLAGCVTSDLRWARDWLAELAAGTGEGA